MSARSLTVLHKSFAHASNHVAAYSATISRFAPPVLCFALSLMLLEANRLTKGEIGQVFIILSGMAAMAAVAALMNALAPSRSSREPQIHRHTVALTDDDMQEVNELLKEACSSRDGANAQGEAASRPAQLPLEPSKLAQIDLKLGVAAIRIKLEEQLRSLASDVAGVSMPESTKMLLDRLEGLYVIDAPALEMIRKVVAAATQVLHGQAVREEEMRRIIRAGEQLSAGLSSGVFTAPVAIAQLLSESHLVLGSESSEPAKVSGLVARLERFLNQNPRGVARSKSLVITLGRLQRRLGDLSSAVATLTRFLDSPGVVLADEDRATLLFNRACYRVLQSRTAKESDRDRLRQLALRDIQASFSLDPNLVESAKRDEDLAGLSWEGSSKV